MSIQNAKVQRLHIETVHSVVWVAALQCCDHQSINYLEEHNPNKDEFLEEIPVKTVSS